MKAIKNFIANLIDRKGLDLLFFHHLYIPDFQDVECCNCDIPIGAYDTKLVTAGFLPLPMELCSMCITYTTIAEVLALPPWTEVEDNYEAEKTDPDPEPDMERLPGYGERSSAGIRAYEYIQDLEERASHKYGE